MRTPVKILTPKEYKALRARPGKCAAPRHVDVVDARANMRTVHLQAKGRVPQEVRRWLSTILREAEAHLRSGGPLRLTRAGAAGKRNRHGLVPINRDTRPQGGTKPALRALHHPPYHHHIDAHAQATPVTLINTRVLHPTFYTPPQSGAGPDPQI